MRFGSVCSGIEAASVAWHPLGWRAAWLSEIEPFPSSELAHHYPSVPNLGDMTTLPDRIVSSEVEAPDVFCGGTPCQAFSVAGLRKSLDDARGNLSLTFCEIANAIDVVRLRAGKPATIVFWENVPGVLSTKDNAFGCFLAGLAGEDDPIEPPGKKWTNAGVILGPQRAVAWRVLDAQYFGVAQRRRRVFVVASARDDFDPAAVLFEFDGLRRDFAPSREARETAATRAGEGATFSCGGIGAYQNDDVSATLLKSGQDLGPGCEALIHAPEIARCIATREGSSQDWESTTMVAQPIPHVDVMPTMAAGADTEAAHNARSGHTKDAYIVSVVQPIAFPANLSATQHASTEDLAPAMGAKNPTAVAHSMAVRRLMPVECERLQGFPDNYTAIPWRNKPASECPDGPRYKALGNSWAVPVVRWIGRRIALAVAIAAAANDNKPKTKKAAA